MRHALAAALLLVAAGPTGAAERDDERWVCVPTEDRQWRCGRGEHAPDPAPLPPAAPQEPAPEGYPSENRRDAGVPAYLRDPALPAPGAEPGPGTAEPASRRADREGTAARPAESATATRERATPGAGRPGAVEETTTVTAPAADEPSTAPAPAREPRYGIQLVAARDPDSLSAFRRRLERDGLDVYRRTWEDAGGTWHVLLAGRYPSAAEARRALNRLPEALRENGAWVRPLADLEAPATEP